MTHQSAPNQPKIVETTALVHLNKPATVQVNTYQGQVYTALRYMYETPDGSLAFGKNGINIPIEWTEQALTEVLEVYNQATGSKLQIIGVNALPDPRQEEA